MTAADQQAGRLGIDIGSHYVGCVLLCHDEVVWKRHVEHHGDQEAVVRGLLSNCPSGWTTIGLTGGSAKAIEGTLDPTLCVVEGARHLHPGCRNVLSVGAQTYLLALYDAQGDYVEHTINPPCAAGTGSFLEQQARRLGMDAAGLARLAQDWSGSVPRIATRCAVFAKTDMIHAQQEGHGPAAICAGLCEGIAHGLVSSLVKGRALHGPVALVGGVARNSKVARCLEETLGLPVVVHEHAQVAGAVGAAIIGGLHDLDAALRTAAGRGLSARSRPPLRRRAASPPEDGYRSLIAVDVEVMLPAQASSDGDDGYAGIDIGSTSTKAVLLTAEGRFAAGFYTTTRGDPLAAVARLGRAATEVLGRAPTLRAAVTTGSGRKMVRALCLADGDVDEISAHARAATKLHPGVDTIIEIGGQDSKFTRLENGQVIQAVMNYVCAAGTGSFIEEQARRLDVPLEEFAELALGVEAPYTSDRCTVYMERDLGTLLAQGWSRASVAAAVLHSVRDNYLAKVVGRCALGQTVVFQGATARNQALVAAFEQHLGRSVHVSPLCHLAGALGAAHLAREQAPHAPAAPSRFQWGRGDTRTEREMCRLCVNRCQLTVVDRDGVRAGWGMKCGREYTDRLSRKVEPSLPERRYRGRILPPDVAPASAPSRGIVAVPTALYHADHAALWVGFLTRLGIEVRMAHTGVSALEAGRTVVNSDFCAPMIVAHGQIKELADSEVSHVFCPALERERVSEPPEAGSPHSGPRHFRVKTTDDYFCYYSQYFPTIASSLTGVNLQKRFMAPLLSLEPEAHTRNVDRLYAELNRAFPALMRDEVEYAWTRALADAAEAARRARVLGAREILSPETSGGLRVVLLGRPYVLLDPALHLGIPRKLEELGAEVYWQDEIDTAGFDPVYAGKYLERMHWRYGKQILTVAELAALGPTTFAVMLSCFRCSPDSFLLTYVRDIMEHYRKPYLALQLDELASDVGYTTRMEAAIRSFRHALAGERAAGPGPKQHARNDALAGRRTVLVPHIDDLISEFWAASFRATGYETVVLTPDERSLGTGYRYCSGGECMPLISILGAAIHAIRDRGLEPVQTFCYLPTICTGCNFPQFPILASHALEAAGLGQVGVGLINLMAPGDTLPQSLAVKMLESQIVGSVLHKMYHRVRPYERRVGAADEALGAARDLLIRSIIQGGDLLGALGQAVAMFQAVERDEREGRKPRIGLLGDLYVKYSRVVNQRLQDVVRELGGEMVVPSITEYAFHFFDADARLEGDDPRHGRLLKRIESRFERVAQPVIADLVEPDFSECVALMEDYGVRHYLAGETSINVGRALYMIRKGQVDAIIHANPMFCCPGVVTASIYRKIQADFGVPIVDIFYDGSGDPNRILIPHLHYLRRLRGRERVDTPVPAH